MFNSPTGFILTPAPTIGSDPHSSAYGRWLGTDVTPHQCFKDLSPSSSLADSDHDWLFDNCELKIAQGFRPFIESTGDNCSEGEPYWAAKYFRPNIVRIAYLLAYYHDCGVNIGGETVDAHWGDSEIITLDVQFNGSTQHWEFMRMSLSQHSSQVWISPDNQHLDFAWGPPLGRPIVFVSHRKHANYLSKTDCEGQEPFDIGCNAVADTGSLLVLPDANIGELLPDGSVVDLLPGGVNSCVPSRYLYPETRTECFWTYKDFRGWVDDVNGSGTTGYYSHLNTTDYRFIGSYAGEGPGDPPPYVPAPTSGGFYLEGPTEVEANVQNYWHALISPAPNPPYTVQWWLDGAAAGGGEELVRSFSAGTSHDIYFVATDGSGNQVHSEHLGVSVSGGGGGGGGGGEEGGDCAPNCQLRVSPTLGKPTINRKKPEATVKSPAPRSTTAKPKTNGQ